MMTDPEVASRSVYVTGLAWETNEDELAAHFSQAGRIMKATVLRKYRRGNSKSSIGCGVVEYESPVSVAHAIMHLNDTELGGRVIRCREDRNPGMHEEEDESTARTVSPTVSPHNSGRVEDSKVADADREMDPFRVFVSSLAWEVTSDELAAAFASVGKVISSEVLTTKKGRSMGSAIVEFAEEASATNAITSMTGVEIKGRVIAVRQCYK